MTLEEIVSNTRKNPEQAVKVLKLWLSENDEVAKTDITLGLGSGGQEINVKDYTGSEKATALLLSLGPELMDKIFPYLSNNEIEKLSIEATLLEKIDKKQKINLFQEFKEKLKARLSNKKANLDNTRKILGRKEL